MANLNKVFLIGNLTRDPELRVTPKGTAICQFGLAINREWRDDAGQTQKETTFIDIEAWGKPAETINKYLLKGRQVMVEGRLKLDTWEDKQSHQKRSKLKVVLESFQFLGARPEGEAAPRSADTPAPGNPPPPPTDNIDEDIPF